MKINVFDFPGFFSLEDHLEIAHWSRSFFSLQSEVTKELNLLTNTAFIPSICLAGLRPIMPHRGKYF